MLNEKQKDTRIQWTIKRKEDDWSRTICTDETFYQLFRNTIHQRTKSPRAEINRIPKNQQITVWDGFSFKGLVDCHSFTNIMDGAYYVQILQDHLILNARKQFDQCWQL